MPTQIDPSNGATTVFPARHAAEVTSGTRLLRRTSHEAVAATRLPEDTPPTLGHLGVLADVAAGQCLSPALPAGQDVRTIGLHLHLSAAPPVGGLVIGVGEPRMLSHGIGLATAQMHLADGTPIAISTLRFMVVEAATHVPDPDPSDLTQLDALRPPPDWDPALGLGNLRTLGDSADAVLIPKTGSRNAAGVLHGGLHVRALELAARAAAGLPRSDAAPEDFRLMDIDMTYHRPVHVEAATAWQVAAQTVRRGRRAIVATAEIASASGKPHTQAQALFLRGD